MWHTFHGIGERPNDLRGTCLDVLALGFLVALVIVLFRHLPTGSWRGDDPSILLHAMQSGGLAAFFDPADWQKLSPSNLTPWITLSFKIDLWSGGADPVVFYRHQLLALVLVASAAYGLCRQWLMPLGAVLTVALFLVGAPTRTVAEMLMTRHYLEGLLFAIVAMICYRRSLSRQAVAWGTVGALAYALALTAKEVYAPLPLVLLALPDSGSMKARWRRLLPYLLVAIAYIFWRNYMLQAVVGGYTNPDVAGLFAGAAGFADTLARFPAFLLGEYWPLAILLWLGVLCLATTAKWERLAFAAALVVAVLLPLLPLLHFPGIHGPDRYLLVFWFVACVTAGLALDAALRPRSVGDAAVTGATLGFFLLLSIPAAIHGAEIADKQRPALDEFDVQGRFILDTDEHKAFVPSASLTSSFWFVTGLCEIKQISGKSCPNVHLKGMPLDSAIPSLYQYDPVQRRMVDVSDRMVEVLRDDPRLDATRPLAIALSIADGFVTWHFGPYEAGQYYIASPDLGRFPLGAQGRLRAVMKDVSFDIQYDSPEGWSTSSPLLKARVGVPVVWERTAKP